MPKVAAARRRIGQAIILHLLGPALLVAGAASVLLVLATKFFGMRLGFGELGAVGWVCVVALPLIVGGGYAFVRARRRWPSLIHAASRLDEISGTHDAIGSSMVFASRDGLSGFESIALRKGEAATSNAQVKDVAKFEFGPLWYASAGSVLVAGLLAWLAPMREIEVAGPQPVVRVQSPAATDEAAEKIAEVKESIEAAASVGQASDEQVEALEELERELMEGVREPDDAVAAAAETLERAADEAAERARRERLESDALREKLNQIDSENFEAAKGLADDLSAGDFESASESAQQLLDEMQQDPERAEEIARELQELADQISPDEADPPQPEQPQETPQSEQVPSAEEIREQLEREGVPPEDAERLAEEMQRELEEQQRQQESRERGEQRADEIADELREAAEQSQEQQDQQQQDPAQQEQQEGGDQQQEQQQGSQSSEQQESQPSQGEQGEQQPGQQGEQQSGNEQGQQEGEQQGEGNQPAQSPSEGAGDQPGEGSEPSPGDGNQQAPGEANEPGQQPSGQSSSNSQDRSQGQDQGQPGGQTPSETGGEGNQPVQTTGGENPDGNPGGQGSGSGEGQQRGLGEVLRENAQREQSAQESEDAARRFQESADQLTGQSPDENPLQNYSPPPRSPWEGDTEFVDARPDEQDRDTENERTIAEWFAPGESDGGVQEPGQVQPGQFAENAGERARRAIEQQSVPRRHAEMIKRVFDRLNAQAKQPTDAPAPVRDAEDAP
ncbi:MAG: hypothetical protein ED559_09625 [Phycisphaera sp.]|nr:MAG: hypothetical protein ED559_09625 [Phycisphaera sp.]